MEHVQRAQADDAREAMAIVEGLVSDTPEQVFQPMTDAVRKLIRVRDGLIASNRGAVGGAHHTAALSELNGVISVAIGAQFPVVGIKRDRIEHTRDALREWLARHGHTG